MSTDSAFAGSAALSSHGEVPPSHSAKAAKYRLAHYPYYPSSMRIITSIYIILYIVIWGYEVYGIPHTIHISIYGYQYTKVIITRWFNDQFDSRKPPLFSVAPMDKLITTWSDSLLRRSHRVSAPFLGNTTVKATLAEHLGPSREDQPFGPVVREQPGEQPGGGAAPFLTEYPKVAVFVLSVNRSFMVKWWLNGGL